VREEVLSAVQEGVSVAEAVLPHAEELGRVSTALVEQMKKEGSLLIDCAPLDDRGLPHFLRAVTNRCSTLPLPLLC
jgi:hypothetical protein